jgi:lipid A 3-O-deacylase
MAKGLNYIAVAALLAIFAIAAPGSAEASNGLYDMSRLLNEPHPFANAQAAPRPAEQAPVARPAQPQRPTEGRETIVRQSKPVNYHKPGGIFSEIRVGAMVHDEGPFSRNKESGFDTNLELLFTSPDFLQAIWSPRPHIGGTYNSDGNTHQAYLGLTWEWDFFSHFFFNFSVGGVYHTGEKVTSDPNKKSLGCSVLFRESLNLGYRINEAHSLMFHFDHISNAKMCSTNEGLETFGLRYGYRF